MKNGDSIETSNLHSLALYYPLPWIYTYYNHNATSEQCHAGAVILAPVSMARDAKDRSFVHILDCLSLYHGTDSPNLLLVTSLTLDFNLSNAMSIDIFRWQQEVPWAVVDHLIGLLVPYTNLDIAHLFFYIQTKSKNQWCCALVFISIDKCS